MSSISVCVIQSLDNFTLSYICYQSTEENTEWTIKNRQDEEKQNKNTTQYVLNTTIHKQTQIT